MLDLLHHILDINIKHLYSTYSTLYSRYTYGVFLLINSIIDKIANMQYNYI